MCGRSEKTWTSSAVAPCSEGLFQDCDTRATWAGGRGGRPGSAGGTAASQSARYLYSMHKMVCELEANVKGKRLRVMQDETI